ncbi:MAG: tRNA (adenosine(37)-N6)-threonylcarbamoyltransferase complex dimerization subunit type 1 TsaB [Oscillospiraceae bacterium]
MNALRILGIDTSGKVASVAFADNGTLVCEKILLTKLTHSQIILPMVKEVMAESGVDFSEIDCIAIADGPGSYTGLRIGIAAVKGICLGSPDIKCAAVSTLESLAYNCVSFCGKIISVMKARVGVVYEGEFISDGTKLERAADDKVAKESDLFENLAVNEKIMLTGDYAKDIKEKYFAENENVICAAAENRLQRASSLCMAVRNNEDLIVSSADVLEPAYLQATKAEKDKYHRD